MQTLLKENKDCARWYPTRIDTYLKYLKLDCTIDGGVLTKRNIAYNLQYIEYIEKQLAELELSSVLITMLYKTYIITGMGIIEALFCNLLKSNKLWNTTEWKSVKIIKSNEAEIMDKQMKVNTEIFEKVDSYDMRMDLDSMIKKVEAKKLLNIDHRAFPILKKLRELRNRVHLQQGDNHYDHDYNNFNYADKKIMGKVLYSILIKEEFCTNTKTCNIYDFLKINLM